jgi:hypothetical protein
MRSEVTFGQCPRPPKSRPKSTIDKPWSVAELEKRRSETWQRIYTKEGQPDYEAYRDQELAKLNETEVDLTPFVYQTLIGHYGGLHVDVPEEKFELFKALWPVAEFPKNTKTKDLAQTNGPEEVKRLRMLFPGSYFANGTKGEKRLDFMKLPRDRELNTGD